MAKKKKNIDISFIAKILVIIGGLNWGLAVFKFNLFSALFSWSVLVENIVYVLVGLSALYLGYDLFKK